MMTVQSAAKPTTAAPTRAQSLFQVGDNVRLNSGSDLMCVTAIRAGGAISCVWYGTNEKIQRATFPAAALEFQPHQIWDAKLRNHVTVPRDAARQKEIERART
jgi:uncharacterized protein YodC (DUF2158 family)